MYYYNIVIYHYDIMILVVRSIMVKIYTVEWIECMMCIYFRVCALSYDQIENLILVVRTIIERARLPIQIRIVSDHVRLAHKHRLPL